MQRFSITFTGRVQGVFFRATSAEVARRFAVTGWVRNEPDGSVQCVVEGEPEELERFVAAVLDAKRSNVEGHHIRRSGATGEFGAFRVIH